MPAKLSMRVVNRHERLLRGSPREVGALVDSLAGTDDRLWPHERWPAQRFDRPLAVGAVGGHGPIRYRVVAYEAGRRVRYAFDWPRGFDGHHEFRVRAGEGGTVLAHELRMFARGLGLLRWLLVFGPLHDALIEDALDKAERSLGTASGAEPRWSGWVRVLRRLLAPGR